MEGFKNIDILILNLSIRDQKRDLSLPILRLRGTNTTMFYWKNKNFF